MNDHELEYNDFWRLIMGMSEPENRLKYIKWLCDNDFKPVKDELLSILKKKELPKMDTDKIIEGMIAESEADFDSKVKNKNYYCCSACAVLIVLRHIFTPEFVQVLEVYDRNPHTKFFVENYWEILKWILLDVNDLGNLYDNEINRDMKYQSNIRDRKIQTVSLHQVLRQGLYGSVSAHSFSDKEISAATGTIRQLIELRIRRAFGILAYQDTQKNNSLVPLNMSDIFNVLDMFREDITFPLKLENIKRIYSWSNHFIHGGYGDYSWIPFFIDIAFRDFIFGHGDESGFDFNNGIVTTQETIYLIQRILTENKNGGKCDANVRYRLLSCTPECKIQTYFTAQKAKVPPSASAKAKAAWKKFAIFRTQNDCWVVSGPDLDDSVAFSNEQSLLDWLEDK